MPYILAIVLICGIFCHLYFFIINILYRGIGYVALFSRYRRVDRGVFYLW